MKVYAVVSTTGGYAREDFGHATCDGVYTTMEKAEIHRIVNHGSWVIEIELDEMPAGVIADAKEFGFIK